MPTMMQEPSIPDLIDRLRKKQLAGDEQSVIDAILRVLGKRPDIRQALSARDVSWLEARAGGAVRYGREEASGGVFVHGRWVEPLRYGFDPNEKRDEGGKWTQGGAKGAAPNPASNPLSLRAETRLQEINGRIDALRGNDSQETYAAIDNLSHSAAALSEEDFRAVAEKLMGSIPEGIKDKQHLRRTLRDHLVAEAKQPKGNPAEKPASQEAKPEADKLADSPKKPSSIRAAEPGDISTVFSALGGESGIADMRAVYNNLKRRVDPNLTKEQFRDLADHMWKARGLELKVLNEVRGLTKDDLDSMVVIPDPKGGQTVYGWAYLPPEKADAADKAIVEWQAKQGSKPATHYARSWNALKSQGQNVPASDLHAAATALAGTGQAVAWDYVAGAWLATDAEVLRYGKDESKGGVFLAGRWI